MKFKNTFLFLFILFFSSFTFSQNDSFKCSSREAKQFNFWVGEWNLTWKNTDGTEAKGENIVKSLFGGCVIEENFNGTPAIPLKGKSFSVYNSRLKKWQQTWVDNNGSYLDFVGEFEDGKMSLSRKAVSPKGENILQRMVFYNISANEFDWNWERSKDNGKTWEVMWQIHYKRKS